MSRIVRAESGRITQVGKKQETGVIVCRACSRLAFAENLKEDFGCPHCHNDVRRPLATDLMDEDQDPPIAIPC